MLALVAMLAFASALAACAGMSSTAAHRSFAGAVVSSALSEPPLRLRDASGRWIDITNYRGRAVLVTFIYTHCPDTCPLIVANLHNALTLLGPQARKVQVIAVSTDPRGDTPAAIRHFVARHAMTGRMKYLVGSRAALAAVWRAWNVSASPATANDRVGHSALVYGISAGGKITTIYASNFKPSDVAHDVPLLAAS